MEWGNNVKKSKDESLKIEAAVKLTAAFFLSYHFYFHHYSIPTLIIFIFALRESLMV